MRKFFFRLLRFSGLSYFFRELIQRNRITILFFHDTKPEAVEEIFNFLKKNYNVISLNDFILALQRRQKQKIPKKALIITFDDGHKGNYRLLPYIQKYSIPITIFLCAGIVGTNRHYWFTLEHSKYTSDELKKIPTKNKHEILRDYYFEIRKEFNERQALSYEEIMEMKGTVNFQSHTMFHPILPMCDEQEAKDEIFESKKILESKFGLAINAIAYPNGDYSDRDIELCKKAGYECGITIDYGFNTLNSDIFRLKRLSVCDTENMDELIVKASGAWKFLKQKIGKTLIDRRNL